MSTLTACACVLMAVLAAPGALVGDVGCSIVMLGCLAAAVLTALEGDDG